MTLKWSYVDLGAGTLNLPDSKVVHIGKPAVDVLRGIPPLPGNPRVITGKKPGTHLFGLQDVWERVRPCVRVVVHPWTFVSIFRRAGWDDDVAYSAERKAAVLKKMLPPNNVPLRRLSQDEGISEATLHSWRKQARGKGQLLPDADAGPEGWSSRDKFAAVVETAAMNAADLAEYCRQRGIFTEQITAWRTACEQANDWDRASSLRLNQATKDEKKRVKVLERDLQRKEKALAEAAALLVLRKKAEAIWGDGEDA